MRQAINDNPVVQAVVIGVLLLGGAVLLMSQMGGKKSSSTVQPVAATGSQAVAPAPTTSSSAVPSTTAPAAPVATGGPLVAGPGLPKRVLADYSSGKTIVLYIYNPKGIDDRDVLAAVNGLRGDSKLAVITTSDKGIARYSRITQGAGVSQVPALVVLSPRGVSGGGEPKATVSYGFRSSEGVTQAVRDAVYKGKTLGYDPG